MLGAAVTFKRLDRLRNVATCFAEAKVPFVCFQRSVEG